MKKINQNQAARQKKPKQKNSHHNKTTTFINQPILTIPASPTEVSSLRLYNK